jgi:hypothetical protein
MLAGKTGAYQSAPLKRRPLALPTNIRLGWKGLPGTNTNKLLKSVNYDRKKSFIVQAHGRGRVYQSWPRCKNRQKYPTPKVSAYDVPSQNLVLQEITYRTSMGRWVSAAAFSATDLRRCRRCCGVASYRLRRSSERSCRRRTGCRWIPPSKIRTF